ncbi:MAG: hypothetical protein R2845_11715 [Thermomicrobiales bacterium]
MSHDDSVSFGAPVDRRKLLGSMAAAVALGLASPALLQQVSAQATPEAEADSQPFPRSGGYASDWPMAQGNFAATRAAASTTIRFDQRQRPWKSPGLCRSMPEAATAL